ncbi:MAG: hypothetical protein LBI02_10390 [Opitutaceae bacterium]|jgi:hypothetical protein|nr:hypothetical protein [Opitutaceae bacterium]
MKGVVVVLAFFASFRGWFNGLFLNSHKEAQEAQEGAVVFVFFALFCGYLNGLILLSADCADSHDFFMKGTLKKLKYKKF